MTRLVRIAGQQMPTESQLVDLKTEYRQRACLVKPLAEVDTANLSEGEMAIFLLAQREKMLAEFWEGTPYGRAARKRFEEMRDALYTGLHVTVGLNHFRQRIASKPASKWLPWSDKMRNPAKGINLLFDDAPTLAEQAAAIGVIPELDCLAMFPTVPVPPGQDPGNWTFFQLKKREACQLENKYRKLFNDHLTKISAHALYEWEENPNAATATVASKALDHRTMVSALANDSKISRSLIKMWMENGVIAGNIEFEAGPWGPIDSIEALKQKAEEEGIAAFPGLAILIPLIIASIAATAFKVKQFIQVIKGEQDVFTAFKESFVQGIQLIGNIEWGPEVGDWANYLNAIPGGSAGGTQNNNDQSDEDDSDDDQNNNGQDNTGKILGGVALAAGFLLLASPSSKEPEKSKKRKK